jgi:hypothetical protein
MANLIYNTLARRGLGTDDYVFARIYGIDSPCLVSVEGGNVSGASEGL